MTTIEKLTHSEIEMIKKCFDNSPKAIYILMLEDKDLVPVYYNQAFFDIYKKYNKLITNKDIMALRYNQNKLLNYDKYINVMLEKKTETFYTFFSKGGFVCNVNCYNLKSGYAILEIEDEENDTIFDCYASKLFNHYSEVYYIDFDLDYYENIYSVFDNFKERGTYSKIVEEKFTNEVIDEADLENISNFLDVCNITRVLETKTSMDFKYRKIDHGWYLLTVVPFRLSDDLSKVILTIKNINDVVNSEVNDRRKYQEASKAKSRFLSRISHDVKTPISNIISLCNDLKLKTTDSVTIDYINKISSSSKYLLTILSDIIDLSKIESGKMLTQIAKCNIKKLCDNIYEFITAISYSYKIDVIYNYDCRHDICYCDEAKLLRTIVNLLTNSIKYSHNNSNVYFKISEVNGDYKIEIKDYGVGIKEEDLPTIFDEFKRLNNKAYQKGSGVGLSIVKKFVEANGGVISVSSIYNHQTTFTLLFDFEVSDEMNIEEDIHNYKYETSRILLCEDNIINVEVITQMLDELSCKYDVCQTGSDCLDLFRNSKYNFYDLILMDVMLPDISGYEVSDKIKSLDRIDNNIPIVSMSANSYDEDIASSKKHKMVAHLNKPINFTTLKVILNKYINKL